MWRHVHFACTALIERVVCLQNILSKLSKTLFSENVWQGEASGIIWIISQKILCFMIHCSVLRAGKSLNQSSYLWAGESWETIISFIVNVVTLVMFRKLVEEVVVDVISTQQNEEKLVLEMILMITPTWFPSFTLPLTAHLYFEQEHQRQVIYK